MENKISIEILPVIFGLLGGLALFLYGMEEMTIALKTIAGKKMKRLLQKATANRFKGAFTGMFVTGVIQSSSVTTVLVVGFMPKDTLGRRIVEGADMVNIFGRPYQLRAEVITLGGFSAHADKNDLLQFVKECRGRLKKVFIVHGEPAQSEELRKRIKSLNIKAIIPRKHQQVYLAAT